MFDTNFFKAHSNMGIIQKIAFAGILLSWVILFHCLEYFMPLGFGYIRINLSLLFILPIFYFSGLLFGISSLLIRLFISPYISFYNDVSIEMIYISNLILFICSFIAIIVMYLFSYVYAKIKNSNKKIILISISSWILTSIILTFLNQVFFTPIYFRYLFPQPLSSVGFLGLAKHIYHTKAKYLFFFGINNYWAGTFVVYLIGNLIKFGIIFIIYLPLAKFIQSLIARSTNKIY